MLPRVLEPEVMDTPEEARDYDAMDHAQVNRVFVADFLAAWHGRGPILDLGTGTAQIPIVLPAIANSDVIGWTRGRAHARAGEGNIRRAGLEGRITLQLVDAKGWRSRLACPAVMSNSIVHHIPDPRAVFAEIARVAAPGGTIFVRDLLRPADAATLNHLVQTYAGDANAHQQKMFAESLHAALTVAEVQALVTAVGSDAAGVRQTTDRHWTWSVPGTR